jgi:hypothetical protein
LTAKASYEKEFYFFDNFNIPNSNCGTFTYTLTTDSGGAVASGVAVVDEIALVPGRKRIYLKDASVLG